MTRPYSLPTLHPALEDGTDRGFRNFSSTQTDAGVIPKRRHTAVKNMKIMQDFEIIGS
jgi:hypothetical protein